MEDPFHWSIDQVIDQVCTSSSNLLSDLSIKPVLNLENLQHALRQNDIDGESLLVLEDVNVKDDLGISSFGQRREIRKIIHHLRSLSALYKTTSEVQPKRSIQETDTEDVSEKVLEPNKRRRIQPETIAPVPFNHSVDQSPEAGEDLEAHWLELLQRWPADSGDEILRHYDESEIEKELGSDDSLGDELEEEGISQSVGLSAEVVTHAIENTIEEQQEAWTAEKRVKKYNAARKRWMQAATAGTRRPLQHALELELQRLRVRFDKMKRYITNPAQAYANVEEVKRVCLNLQPTVEDMMERQYYLDVLESNQPPERPAQQFSQIEKIPLPADEESLASSKEGEEESSIENELLLSEQEEEISVASESGVSLDYDPADDDWHPQIPQEADSALRRSLNPQHQSAHSFTEDEGYTDSMQLESPIFPEAGPSTPHIHKTLADGLDQNSMILDETDDSDLDRIHLPESRYRSVGNTKETAISLCSSPAASDHEILSDHSIRTPPLNPTTPSKLAKMAKFVFPDIRETRNAPWASLNKDDELAFLCKIVYRHSRENARDVLDYTQKMPISEMMEGIKACLYEIQDADEEDLNIVWDETPILWTFFFVVYATQRGYPSVWSISEEKIDEAFEMVDAKVPAFDRILKPLLRFYINASTTLPPKMTNVESSAMNRPYPLVSEDPMSDMEVESDTVPSSVKRRKRPVQQSQEAMALQRDDRDRVQLQEERRRQMIERFQRQPTLGQAPKIIVNTEEPPIYLDPHIAMRIKDHQISGVQFIWRELIEDEKHQGCLLAHTMGLGKTMQVISFLITLAQVKLSPDPRLRALIPDALTNPKIVVMCPASLVDNWYDELLMWTPIDNPDLLGGIYRISGTRKAKIDIISEWNRRPGVLLISYESLRSLLKTSSRVDDSELAFLQQSLLFEPSVVVGDEAHKMKNAKSSINQCASKFRTASRIALTGSPLNNHLEEYHTMINWIAPGYLGNIVQFKAKYSEPIQRGLYEESTRYEKRKSLERLYILKRDLAAKIDRKDISAIASDMPQKTEFFITIPLTKIQKDIYTAMVSNILSGIRSQNGNAPKSTNAQLWSWLSILSWLNNHPSCLIKKLQEKDVDAYQLAMEAMDADAASVLPADMDLTSHPVAGLLPKFLECFRNEGVDPTKEIDNPNLSYRALVSQYLIEESIRSGEKILLFSHSIPTLDYLQAMLTEMSIRFLRIDGSTRTDQRQLATKHFNEDTDEYMVFLISTRAGGLGLNLQGATRVIIYDFGFNPSWEEQAIGRAYRLGQRKPVFVYRFQAGGTFEQTIHNKSIFKTQLFSRVVDQKNVVRHASKKLEDYLFVPRDVERDPNLEECLGKDLLLDRVSERAPEVIRNLVLTETFQREDEEDKLTEQERQECDFQVEMEKLQRINPALYQEKLRQYNAKMRHEAKIASQSSAPSHFPGGTVSFHNIFNPTINEDVARTLPLRTPDA